MKTQQITPEVSAKNYQRNSALGLYIICITTFVVTYTALTAVTVL